MQILQHRVRPAVAAFAGAILAALLLRSFAVGVGPDEFSLLVMAEAVRSGAFPYEVYWDVRPPLAYLWALPSAGVQDAGVSVALLRLLAWAVQAGAAWIFFCLFQRTLGIAAAALGALCLLVAANMTGLHAAALPNHFAMAMAVAAFACLVAGLRGGPAAHCVSALLAGLLPWMMTQAGLAALSLAALAVLGGARTGSWRRPLLWLGVFSLPTVAMIGAYFLWGPFETFARTVFMAPFAVLDMRSNVGGYRFFSSAELWRILAESPWAIAQAALLGAGAVWLAGAIRAAPRGAPLRLCPFLAAPLAAGFAIMVYAKPPAPPEYWIDMAPALALLAAVAASKLLAWPGWAAPRVVRRVRPAVLRPCLAACFACILILPVDPWAEPPKPPLPKAYCSDIAVRWVQRLAPNETVLDLVGICGFHLLGAGAKLHPPFTFAPMWLRQFGHPWIGRALAGDGSPAAAAARLREALAPGSGAGLILADDQLLREVRSRGWERWFFKEWRLVWFRQLEGRAAEERLGALAVLVRRDGQFQAALHRQ